MSKISGLVLLFSVITTQIRDEKPTQFIVWNVGQGLWSTATQDKECFHFDAGGEKRYFYLILPVVKKLCTGKNIFSFSHWDLDHISFVGRFSAKGLQSCLLKSPGGETKSIFKKRWLEKLRSCVKNTSSIQEIMFPKIRNQQTTNESSRVFIFRREILLPGDSPIQSEKIWAEFLQKNQVRVLVLGHHGSRTSTGVELLKKIPTATMAVASSNSNRYGHPHREVKKKLKKYGIALLETQIWGNIHISL